MLLTNLRAISALIQYISRTIYSSNDSLFFIRVYLLCFHGQLFFTRPFFFVSVSGADGYAFLYNNIPLISLLNYLPTWTLR